MNVDKIKNKFNTTKDFILERTTEFFYGNEKHAKIFWLSCVLFFIFQSLVYSTVSDISKAGVLLFFAFNVNKIARSIEDIIEEKVKKDSETIAFLFAITEISLGFLSSTKLLSGFFGELTSVFLICLIFSQYIRYLNNDEYREYEDEIKKEHKAREDKLKKLLSDDNSDANEIVELQRQIKLGNENKKRSRKVRRKHDYDSIYSNRKRTNEKRVPRYSRTAMAKTNIEKLAKELKEKEKKYISIDEELGSEEVENDPDDLIEIIDIEENIVEEKIEESDDEMIVFEIEDNEEDLNESIKNFSDHWMKNDKEKNDLKEIENEINDVLDDNDILEEIKDDIKDDLEDKTDFDEMKIKEDDLIDNSDDIEEMPISNDLDINDEDLNKNDKDDIKK